MIPIHATATANPQQLRWVVAAARLPARGTVRAAPGRLGALLDDGVIDEIEVRTTDVLISLRADRQLARAGDDVRDALCDALLDPAGWQVDSALDDSRPADRDRRRVARRSDRRTRRIPRRGDRIGVGRTATTSTCGCRARATAARRPPATLHDKLQRELRRRSGRKVTVCTENDSVALPLGRRLLSLIVR